MDSKLVQISSERICILNGMVIKRLCSMTQLATTDVHHIFVQCFERLLLTHL